MNAPFIPIEGSSVPALGPACVGCITIQYAHRLDQRWQADQQTILDLRKQLAAAKQDPAQAPS